MKHELLAPAGDLERLKVAIHYGADAVYIGGPAFGLRANANNFTLEEMKEGVEFAHERGKKVYATVNIVLHQQELEQIQEYLIQLEKTGIDAIIVSDPAIIQVAKEYTQLEIHLSTQQSTLNVEAVKFFKSQGVTRIVLGREVSKEEIQAILDQVDIEIEVFIHGAMCSSYSGRCVLSNFLTARDSNRGGCSQICRWDFDLYDAQGNFLEGEKPFTFCTKDLSMIQHLPEMMDMGITSFKIEGRMRSIYYIATVVDTYRKAIDTYLNNPKEYVYDSKWERILRRVANRDSVPQFFNHKNDHECQYYNGRMELSNQDFLGVVLDDKDGMVTLEQRNYFKVGDTVEFFGPHHETYTFVIPKVTNEEGEEIDVVRHPREIVTFPCPFTLEPMDMMRKKDG